MDPFVPQMTQPLEQNLQGEVETETHLDHGLQCTGLQKHTWTIGLPPACVASVLLLGYLPR